MEVSLNYCSQNGGNLYRAPYDNRDLNLGPRIDSNLGPSPYRFELGKFERWKVMVSIGFKYTRQQCSSLSNLKT